MKDASAAMTGTKGARTRRRIVERAAAVFNTQGVAGTSMADISAATGLEKGGVYNHFATKDALALAAFDHAAGLVRARREAAARTAPEPLARLRALIDVYRDVPAKPFLAGGCPILNTAIEADDTHPLLRNRARKAMDHWRALIGGCIDEAAAAGAIEPVASETFASTAIAALEGGIMLSALYRDWSHLAAVVEHLHRWIDLLVRRAQRTAP